MNGFAEALQRGLAEIPPVAIAIALLAGPTIGMIGYRFLSNARRLRSADEVAAAPYWVCVDCRSVNELRLSRCYHCHQHRDAHEELEVIVDAPERGPGFFEAPAGSPFAALGARSPAGIPVMSDEPSPAVAVGPGQKAAAEAPLDDLVPATRQPA